MADPRFERARRRVEKHRTLDPTIKKKSKSFTPRRKNLPRVGNFVPNIPLDATQVDDRRFDGFVQDIFHWFTAEIPRHTREALRNTTVPLPRTPLPPKEVKRRLQSISPPRRAPAKAASRKSRVK